MNRNRARAVLAGVLYLVVAVPAVAQVQAPPAASLPTSDRLTGNWNGTRDALSGHGVDLQLEVTTFAQGMISGTGDDATEPGVRFDGLVNVDLQKLGLWQGSGIRTHVEVTAGDLPVFRGGALWPMHSASALPVAKRDDVVATSLYFTQRLGGSASLMLGKINAVDLLARDPFFGGWGIHRFENIAFVAPPSGLVPPVLMGGVLAVAKGPWSYTAMVFDPDDRTAKYWVDDLFENGVNVQVGATWSGTVDDRPTSLGVSATASSADGADLSEVLLPPELRGGTKNGSWGVAVQWGHLIAESAAVEGKGLGVYGKAALSDGNPNLIRGSFVGGLASHGSIASRPYDSFGVGFYYYRFSDALEDAVDPVFGFGDEQGLEVFYNLSVTRWCRLGADLQFVGPATSGNATVVVGGVRANIVF